MRLAVLAFFLSSAPAHAVDAPFNLKQQVTFGLRLPQRSSNWTEFWALRFWI
jgi:hypothetical protein